MTDQEYKNLRVGDKIRVLNHISMFPHVLTPGQVGTLIEVPLTQHVVAVRFNEDPSQWLHASLSGVELLRDCELISSGASSGMAKISVPRSLTKWLKQVQSVRQE